MKAVPLIISVVLLMCYLDSVQAATTVAAAAPTTVAGSVTTVGSGAGSSGGGSGLGSGSGGVTGTTAAASGTQGGNNTSPCTSFSPVTVLIMAGFGAIANVVRS